MYPRGHRKTGAVGRAGNPPPLPALLIVCLGFEVHRRCLLLLRVEKHFSSLLFSHVLGVHPFLKFPRRLVARCCVPKIEPALPGEEKHGVLRHHGHGWASMGRGDGDGDADRDREDLRRGAGERAARPTEPNILRGGIHEAKEEDAEATHLSVSPPEP